MIGLVVQKKPGNMLGFWQEQPKLEGKKYRIGLNMGAKDRRHENGKSGLLEARNLTNFYY